MSISGIPEADQSPRLRSLEREHISLARARDEAKTTYDGLNQQAEKVHDEIMDEKRYLNEKNQKGTCDYGTE